MGGCVASLKLGTRSRIAAEYRKHVDRKIGLGVGCDARNQVCSICKGDRTTSHKGWKKPLESLTLGC